MTLTIRKTALVAFITTCLSLLLPTWNALQSVIENISRARPFWWGIPIVFAGFLASASMPVFFFALCRNQTTLFISKGMRLLSKGGALIFGILVFAALRSEFADPGFVARGGMSEGLERTILHIDSLLSAVSNFAAVLLLASFNLHSDEGSSSNAPPSRFLVRATRIAFAVSAVALAFLAIRILASPFVYSSIKNSAAQYGTSIPPFSTFLEATVRDAALQTLVSIAPFVIFRSLRAASATDDTMTAHSPASGDRRGRDAELPYDAELPRDY